jgi:hypothetical protein
MTSSRRENNETSNRRTLPTNIRRMILHISQAGLELEAALAVDHDVEGDTSPVLAETLVRP